MKKSIIVVPCLMGVFACSAETSSPLTSPQTIASSPPSETPPPSAMPRLNARAPSTTVPSPTAFSLRECEADSTCIVLRASDPEARVQAAFATAKPGQRIELGPGTFRLTNTIAITTSKLTVRGAGRDKTILDFSGQKTGSDGIYAESLSSLVFDSFSVVDSRGNGIKVLGGDKIVMRKLGVSWRGADASAHGPYGLYPVQSKNVLVEDCVVTGASDSGIYLGQSDRAVLRRNEVHGNVAGIEVENTFRTDVYENLAHDNTGGILVFDLPGLPQKGGHEVRVHDNVVTTNNRENFAPAGNIVGLVPRGTGILVMANADVEIWKNTISGNSTFGVAIASYFVTQLEIKDGTYYPFPLRVNVHDNTFSGGGNSPDPKSSIGALLGTAMGAFPNGAVPPVVFDGITDPSKGTGTNPDQVCMRGNGAAKFANLHLDKVDPNAPDLPGVMSLDATPHDCALTAVAAPVVEAP